MGTKERRKRRAALIRILTEMSRDWGKWTASNWQPLERELEELSND